MDTSTKREVTVQAHKGLQLADLMLIAILLAAGAVLKFFVGNVINFGMKPNFIIAMYCLIILLIRPRILEAAIIGILAGAVCQFFPGFPFINLASELIGAIVMCLLVKIPFEGNLAQRIGKTVVATFISTCSSGFSFVGCQYLLIYGFAVKEINGAAVKPTALAAFLPIILGTATINAIIVQILYPALRRVLKKNVNNVLG